VTPGRSVLASSVEAPRERVLINPRVWLVRLSLLVFLAAGLLGCSPAPETKETAHPVCAWGRDTACCIPPPPLKVVKLADLRAERFAKAYPH
jgi:hypothetical protein